MGNIETVEEIPVGNTLGLDGVDKSIIKTATVTDTLDGYPFKTMSFSVAPVVQISLVPKNPSDLPKFSEGIKKFIKSDPCLQYRLSEEGEHILAGAGELHLDVAVTQLREDFLKNVDFRTSDPIVPYCETVVGTSSITCLSKSPNHHNRLFCRAEPMGEELTTQLEDGNLPKDPKLMARQLIDNHGWGEEARKVWCTMPEVKPTNMWVDQTKGIAYLLEIKDHVKAGYAWTAGSGVMSEEPMRGVRINMDDVTLHADSIHRGGGQILPTVRRVVYACMLTAQPRLMEPIYKLEVQAPRMCVGSIYSTVSQRGGQITNEEVNEHNPLCGLSGLLPVARSFGFIQELRGVTSGQAFAQYSFSHWSVINSDPLENDSDAHKLVKSIRKRKGLGSIEIPPLGNYLDKL